MNQLIQPGCEPYFGFITEPVKTINYMDYVYRHPLGKQVSHWRRNLAFKQFQFFGIWSEEWMLGCAIADLKYLTAAFYYRYHFPTQSFFQYSFKQPFNFQTSIDAMPDHGEWRFKHGKNSFIMRVSNHIRTLEVQLSNKEYVNVSLLEQDTDPLRLCTRSGINGWTYTQKNAGLIAKGEIFSHLGKSNLHQALGQHDWSAGFMQREIFWNWASLSGKNLKYGIFGLNVSAGVNETSFNENCYWLRGKRYPLNNVSFIYSRQHLLSPWEIKTEDKRLCLTFTPQGRFQERTNALLIANHFHQLFGYFSGSITLDNGQILSVETAGIVEEHYAKW